jgi:hypothetical protein
MTNPIKSFFLFCSGATSSILKRKECEVEHTKYAGIGGTIFFTAALASLSGGYAMFTVFHSGWLAFAFGLLWGLIIFNLDRFIVSSIRKPHLAANLPLTQWLTAKGGEILKALPRIILAVFISIVITTPLELKFFGAEIQGQLPNDLAEERKKAEERINPEFSDIGNLEEETGQLKNRLVDLENEVNRRVKVASSELDGWGGTKNPGDGPEYKKRLAETKQAEQELNTFRTQYAPVIEAKEKQILKRKGERDEKLKAAYNKIDASGGLQKQLDALSTLASQHRSMRLASIFLILLFISLETAPVLVKLFSNRGPYDDYLDAIEHQVYASQRKNVSDINDDVNTLVALSKQRNADRIATELQMSQNTMASWTTLAPQEYHDAQVEIARIGVALWKANELNRLKHVTPPLPHAVQLPTSVSPSAPPFSSTVSSQNIPPPSGPASTTTPPGASTVGPQTNSPSPNGGGVNTSVGASTPAGTTQSTSQTGAQAASVGAPPSPPETNQQEQSSTAPQTSSVTGQQTNPGAQQTPQNSNSNVSTP